MSSCISPHLVPCQYFGVAPILTWHQRKLTLTFKGEAQGPRSRGCEVIGLGESSSFGHEELLVNL